MAEIINDSYKFTSDISQYAIDEARNKIRNIVKPYDLIPMFEHTSKIYVLPPGKATPGGSHTFEFKLKTVIEYNPEKLKDGLYSTPPQCFIDMIPIVMDDVKILIYNMASDDKFIPRFTTSTSYDAKFMNQRAYFTCMMRMLCRLYPADIAETTVDMTTVDKYLDEYLAQRPLKKQRKNKLVENYESDS